MIGSCSRVRPSNFHKAHKGINLEENLRLLSEAEWKEVGDREVSDQEAPLYPKAPGVWGFSTLAVCQRTSLSIFSEMVFPLLIFLTSKEKEPTCQDASGPSSFWKWEGNICVATPPRYSISKLIWSAPLQHSLWSWIHEWSFPPVA